MPSNREPPDDPSTHTNDAHDAARLGRFLRLASIPGVPVSLALFGVFAVYPSPLFGLVAVSLLVYSAIVFLAYRYTKSGDIDRAINLYLAATLQLAFGIGLGGIRFFALTALAALLSVIVSVPYVSVSRLRTIAIATAIVVVTVSIPSLLGFEIPVQPVPDAVITPILALGVPTAGAVLIAALWQSRLALSEASRHLRETNEALKESERLLEEKVAQRTQALQDSRTELAQARDEAVAANRHKSAFLANMSHELRTPLNAVIGFSEVLLERVFGDLNDKQAEYLGDIHSSGKHLLSLINDILDLSKIEAGRLELSLKAVEVSVTFENAMVLMRDRANRGGVKLETDVEPDLGTVIADERKLKQILINLLSNAVKFTKAGGHVTLRATRNGQDLEIAVVDTGIGIAPENHSLVFEEFRQASDDYASAQEGTGLGLALTKRLVELHGGKIWLESSLDEGSTFALRIPIDGGTS